MVIVKKNGKKGREKREVRGKEELYERKRKKEREGSLL